MKSYRRVAWGLIIAGMSIFGVERFGLTEWLGGSHQTHLNGTLLSAMVIAPLALIAMGCLVFVFARVRGAK